MQRPDSRSKAWRFEVSDRIAPKIFADIDDVIDILTMHRNRTDRVIEELRTRFDGLDYDLRAEREQSSKAAPSLRDGRDIDSADHGRSSADESTGVSDASAAEAACEGASAERDRALRERDAAVRQRDAALRAQRATPAERSQVHVDRQGAQAEIASLAARLSQAETALRSLEASTAWKITWPLRRGLAGFPRVRRIGRQATTAAWWIATFRFSRLRRPSAALARRRSVARTDYRAAWTHPVVLFVDSVYPRPDRDSGSLDTLNFLKAFALLGYHVVFVASDAFSERSKAREELEGPGVCCDVSQHFDSVEAFIREAGDAIDVAFLSRVYSGGRFIETMRAASPRTKIIFNTVDLHHVREERQARVMGNPALLARSLRTRTRELEVARLADATIVVSDSEKAVLDEIAPDASTHVIRLARDVSARVDSFRSRAGIGFIGGYPHVPNVDAVHYFLDAIWPLVRERLPGVEFRAMGADMPAELRDRTDPGYRAVGYVADLAEEMNALRLTVAPLRFGAGVKGKIASSLAHGVPCVATSLGADGMGLVDGSTIAIADTPDEFVRRIVDIYTDERIWMKYSDDGLTFMKAEYSFSSTRDKLETILSTI